MPITHATHTPRPVTNRTADQAPLIARTVQDRVDAWDDVLTLRLGRNQSLRAASRLALRAAATSLAASEATDAPGTRAPAVRVLLGRRRPARATRRDLLLALVEADRRNDDRALRAAVAMLTSAGVRSPAHASESSLRRGLDRLVAENYGLVRDQVRLYLRGRTEVLSLERADLEQEGALGLLRGLRGYDPSRGFAVSTYVVPWIRQAIARAVDDQAATVRAPVHLVATVAKIARARREAGDRGASLSIDQLAAATGRSPKQVRSALAQYPVTTSADQPLGNSRAGADARTRGAVEPGPTFLDRLADPSPWDYAEALAAEQMQDILRDHVRRLPAREAGVIAARYLDGDDVPTFESVGRELGVSRERVRQIENKALGKVREEVARSLRPAGRQHEARGPFREQLSLLVGIGEA